MTLSTRSHIHTSKRWLITLLSCVFLIMSAPAKSADSKLEVLYLTHYQQEQALLLDGFVKYQLSQAIQEALAHEILLTFETDIELLDKQSYWGVPYRHSVKRILFESTLQYSNYNQTYYITNKRNNQVRAFSQLKDALATLGTLSQFHLIDLSELYHQHNYEIHLRVTLNRWKLPTPLILDSVIDSDWSMDSDDYVIEIEGTTP